MALSHWYVVQVTQMKLKHYFGNKNCYALKLWLEVNLQMIAKMKI